MVITSKLRENILRRAADLLDEAPERVRVEWVMDFQDEVLCERRLVIAVTELAGEPPGA